MLLGFIHRIMKEGLVIFPPEKRPGMQPNAGCVLKFLSYSNSQIKRHSAWFLVQTVEPVPDVLSEKIIMDSMGDF
jgi:hypothetical protein